MIIEQEAREEELNNNEVVKEPTTEHLVAGTCCNTPNRLEQQRAPSTAATAYFNIPQEPTTPYTPRNVIKRKLLAVPPTPVEVDDSILKLMLSEMDISIVGTPSVRRKLPQTQQNSSQDKILQGWSESRIQQQDRVLPSWSASTKHDKSLPSRSESINTSSELVDDHNVIQYIHPPDVECRVNSVQFQVSESIAWSRCLPQNK